MTDNAEPAVDPERDFHLGRADSGREVVLYGEYTSPACRRLRDILRRIAERLSDRIVYVYRQFPEPGDATAERAARAAIAAGQQGRFWEMHQALFQRGQGLSAGEIRELADQIGLEADRFTREMESEEVEAHLARDRQSAQTAGVTRTPTLLIEGRPYLGSWDELSILEAIERPLGFRVERASQRFFGWAASGGFVLVLASLAALIAVNTGFADLYETLTGMPFALMLGDAVFSLSLKDWINDGLMTVFFLIVGIEIKRELVSGELSSLSNAMLPIIGAIGGMVVPAGIYLLLNWGEPTQHGWGVPMATDIAFTIGLMALLGRRVPNSLRIFVSALAIADDLGAIVVIALFYGHGLHFAPLAAGVACLVVMALLNRARVYRLAPYLVLGVLLWALVHASGLHATLAGVLTAAMIPSRPAAKLGEVAAQAKVIADTTERDAADPESEADTGRALGILENAIAQMREPGHHLQRALENWTNFLILPLFAFFNTGILLAGSAFSPFAPQVSGVILGLVVGKPLGIFAACWIATRLGWARLSSEISWLALLGAACLAGVGFTMSIFIATAAFSGPALSSVKLAVLLASTVSALLGIAILQAAGRASARRNGNGTAQG